MSNCSNISGKISNNIKFKIEFIINHGGEMLHRFSAISLIRIKRETYLCKKMRAACLNACRNKPKLRKSK